MAAPTLSAYAVGSWVRMCVRLNVPSSPGIVAFTGSKFTPPSEAELRYLLRT